MQHLSCVWGVVVWEVRFSDLVRRLVLLGCLDGRSYRVVADELGMTATSVWRIRHDPDVLSQVCASTGSRLGLADREEISRGLAAGLSLRRIARGLGRDVSTISREVNRNGGRHEYRAAVTHGATVLRACRPKPTVFEKNRPLAIVVEA